MDKRPDWTGLLSTMCHYHLDILSQHGTDWDGAGIEIVAGKATRAGITMGNHWGTGMGMIYGTPAKPVPRSR